MSSPSPSDTLAEKVEHLVAQVADSLGLEVYDLEVQPQGRIVVMLERPGAAEPGTGVTVGELGRANREINGRLEVSGVIPFDWELEVGSPGVERALRRPEHWQGQVGARVRVVMMASVSGDQVVEGTIVECDEETANVRTDSGGVVHVPLAQVRRARTVFEIVKGRKRPVSRKGKGGKG
ncbi:MAG: hypothetical protein EA398_06065 [Deltaproteobacteria bacterium]|nr:MAG: hypothetical protein EA398_06065 [Deltaproteobacteria bacterium]